jgi:hypothetical protein
MIALRLEWTRKLKQKVIGNEFWGWKRLAAANREDLTRLETRTAIISSHQVLKLY